MKPLDGGPFSFLRLHSAIGAAERTSNPREGPPATEEFRGARLKVKLVESPLPLSEAKFLHEKKCIIKEENRPSILW